MADTGELDVDQDLIGTGLGNRNLFIINRTSGLLEDLRPLLLRDGQRHATVPCFSIAVVSVVVS